MNTSAEEIERMSQALLYDLQSATQIVGFLEGTIENDPIEKLTNSYAGHAGDIAIRSVASAVALFVCRQLDDNGDSLMRLSRILLGEGATIEARRRVLLESWPEGSLEIGEVEAKIVQLSSAITELRNSKEVTWIIAHRNDRLAHALAKKSPNHQRLLREKKEQYDVSYRDVCDVANEIIRLGEHTIQVVDFSIVNLRSRTRIARDYTKSFWEFIPKLSDIESASE